MPAPTPSRARNEEFDLIYRREVGFVWRVLRYHGVPPESIEDAVQDVFMVVHRRWDDWDRGESVRSWLFGIARRIAGTRRRGEDRHQRKLAALPELTQGAHIEALAANRETLRRLALVLEDMDTRLASVFVLADIESLTAAEVAEQLGIGSNTVYSRLRRARELVNRAMADMERSS